MHPANTTFGFVCSLVANTQMHQMLDVHGDESIEETVKKTPKKNKSKKHTNHRFVSLRNKNNNFIPRVWDPRKMAHSNPSYTATALVV